MTTSKIDKIIKEIHPLLDSSDSHTRGKLGEYLVSHALLEFGWKVYEPLEDAYVDFILHNKKFRTIQVKTSKLIDGKKFRLNHDPKDLLHDPRHFFIWFLYNQNDKKGIFVIIRPEEFCNYISSDKRHGLITDTWRKNKSREDIRLKDLKEDGKLVNYVNNWNRLRQNFSESNLIGVQEKVLKWKNSVKFKKRWIKNQEKLKRLLSDQKLNDHGAIIDEKTRVRKRLLNKNIRVRQYYERFIPKNKKQQHLERGLKYASAKINGYNIFQKIGTVEYVILKIICKDCKKLWEADEKECFKCKIWRPPITFCTRCKTINKQETTKKCVKCQKRIKIGCIGCSSKIEKINTVPLTQCIMCGSRENRFEIKMTN